MERIIEHWWNGAWGRLARYDVRLFRWGDTDWWRVVAMRGGVEGRETFAQSYRDEATARAELDRLRAEPPGQRWQLLSGR